VRAIVGGVTLAPPAPFAGGRVMAIRRSGNAMATLEPDILSFGDADEIALSETVPLGDHETPAFASLLRQVARTPGHETPIEADAELAPGTVVAEVATAELVSDSAAAGAVRTAVRPWGSREWDYFTAW